MLSWSLLVVRLHGDADIDAVTNYDVRRPTSDTDTTVAANDSELRLEARDLHDATQHLLHLRRNVFHAEDGDGQLNHVHPTPATAKTRSVSCCSSPWSRMPPKHWMQTSWSPS